MPDLNIPDLRMEDEKGDGDVLSEDVEVVIPEDSLVLTPQEHRRLSRMIGWRILPYFSLLCLLSFLDRVNIGQARLAGLEEDLNLHGQQYDIALTVFFASYVVAELPSNLVLRLFKPHRWITFIMVCWSTITILMGTVTSYGGLVAARFTLGLAEGGLFPGLNFVLTTWYSRREQNLVISLFFAGSTLSGAFGGILAYGIRHMDGIGGKGGWAWIFILEGLVTLVCAIPAWWIIPDFPEDDRLLHGVDQHRWVHHLVQSQGVTNTPIPFSWRQVKRALTDWRTYVYALIYLGLSQPYYSLSLFTPSIIAALGYTNANANLLSVPPFAFAFVTTLSVGWYSDRSMRRGIIILICAVVTIVGYIVQMCDVSPGAKYFGVFLCVGSVSPGLATTITWIGNNVGPIYTRAAAMGFFFATGTSAGIIASNVYPSSTAPRFFEGHGISLGFAFMAILCTIVMMVANQRDNRRKDSVYGKVASDGSDADPGKALDEEKRKLWGLDGMGRLQIIELGDRHPGFRYII